MSPRVDENGILKRPTCSCEFVKARAAELALPRVKELGCCPDRPDAKLLEHLAGSLALRDGFEIAERLSSSFDWSPNSSLVSVLDEGWIGDALEEHEKQWVASLGIRIPFVIGDRVAEIKRRAAAVGTVVELRPETAKVGVRFPGMPPKACFLFDVECLRAEA